MPSATELTIHIYSAIAQDEAKRINERTKSALMVKKQLLAIEGKKLGDPQNLTYEARLKGVERIKLKAANNENNQRAKAFIKQLNGTLLQKAILLNESGFRTAKNKLFTRMQVSKLMVVL